MKVEPIGKPYNYMDRDREQKRKESWDKLKVYRDTHPNKNSFQDILNQTRPK